MILQCTLRAVVRSVMDEKVFVRRKHFYNSCARLYYQTQLKQAKTFKAY